MSKHWSAEHNPNYQSRKLSGWIIRYDPTPDGKVNADGSTSYSLNFPALALTDIVADPEKQAVKIAAILECHEEVVAALGGLLRANDDVQTVLCDGPEVPGFDPSALGKAQQRVTEAENVARAALAKAGAA